MDRLLFFHIFGLLICTIELKFHTNNNSKLAPPVSCEWNLWQTEDCSVSCGEGTQTKRRTKTTNNESPIRRCSGESVIKVPCNVASCPGKVFSLNLPNMHVLFIVANVLLI